MLSLILWQFTFERFVEDNFIEKGQRDENIKKLSLALENFVRDNVKSKLTDVVSVKIQTLNGFKGELPKYETKHASGMDVKAQLDKDIVIAPGERAIVATGLSVAIPPGFEIQVRPRSGLAVREGLTVLNSPGTIDADYRGEIKVILVNLGGRPVKIQDQERVAQFVLCPTVTCRWEEVKKLDETLRGEGGFGSTGQA